MQKAVNQPPFLFQIRVELLVGMLHSSQKTKMHEGNTPVTVPHRQTS